MAPFNRLKQHSQMLMRTFAGPCSIITLRTFGLHFARTCKYGKLSFIRFDMIANDGQPGCAPLMYVLCTQSVFHWAKCLFLVSGFPRLSGAGPKGYNQKVYMLHHQMTLISS